MKKLFIIMTILASAVLAACSNGEVVDAIVTTNSVVVSTISPETGNITVMGEYIGIMEPNQQVAVIPRIPGEVVSVYVGVGDTVQAGDVLFTIDAADIITNVAALEAQLAVQDATVRAAQTGVQLVDGSAMQSQRLSVDGGVIQATAAIAQAEAGISQAKQNVEQARIGIEQAEMAYNMAYQSLNDTATLFNAGAVSRVAFEQAEAGYQNAQAGLERAISGYEMATIGLSQAELGYAQAQQGHTQALEGQRIATQQAPAENRRRAQDALAQAQAARDIVVVNLNATQDRLNDATVTAPISGVILARNVDEFSFASPQAPAFIISDQYSMSTTFRVPRHSAQQLEVGSSITLYDGSAEIAGTITEIAIAVDMSGLIAITATIPNPPVSLISGMSVRIFAQAQSASDVLILPLNAIHHDRGIAHVFIATNGLAVRTPVELGIFDEFYAQIISGVTANCQVISTWSARLVDGVEIEIR